MKEGEKAKELVERFKMLSDGCSCYEYACVCFFMSSRKAKQCALICVDEIIKAHETLCSDVAAGEAKSCLYTKKRKSFWQGVKKEIDKL